MKCIVSCLNETGIVIVNITCDNPVSNWSMFNNLGAKLYQPEPKVTLDVKNILGIPIFAILDVCHLLKLLRNSWGDYKVLIDGNGNAACWNYVERLHDLQTSSGLHLANRLRSQHIDFKSNKMDTSLAAQTLSKSVAKSIGYCDKVLENPSFTGSEATINFIRTFDDLFDLLNSKSKFGKDSKGPLCKKNFDVWSEKFKTYTQYILSLKHGNGVPVIKGPRKAAFLGFIVTMKSFLHIYCCYVQTGHLDYVLTFKFSQDHIEQTFSTIRSSLGGNNNPTVKQFEASYKSLLLNLSNKVKKNDANVNVSLIDIPVMKSIVPSPATSELEWIDLYCDSRPSNEYQNNVLTYISGYVQRRLLATEKCAECINFLRCEEKSSSDFVDFVNEGKLTKPSKSLDFVVKKSDMILNSFANQNFLYSQKNITERICQNVVNMMAECHPEILSEVDHFGNSFMDNHKLCMMRKICALYVSLRLKHAAREKKNTLVEKRVRRTMTKVILFKNQ